MVSDGVNRNAVHVQDTLTVVGFPARSGDPVLSAKEATLPVVGNAGKAGAHNLLASEVTLPDGKKWSSTH